jgi:hypothetical protein
MRPRLLWDARSKFPQVKNIRVDYVISGSHNLTVIPSDCWKDSPMLLAFKHVTVTCYRNLRGNYVVTRAR